MSKNKFIVFFMLLNSIMGYSQNSKPNFKYFEKDKNYPDADIKIVQGMYYGQDGNISFSQNDAFFTKKIIGKIYCNGIEMNKTSKNVLSDNRDEAELTQSYSSTIGTNLKYSFTDFKDIDSFNLLIYAPQPFVPSVVVENKMIHIKWKPDTKIANNRLTITFSGIDLKEKIMETVVVDSKKGQIEIPYSSLKNFKEGEGVLVEFSWGSSTRYESSKITINLKTYFNSIIGVKL